MRNDIKIIIKENVCFCLVTFPSNRQRDRTKRSSDAM